MKASVTTERPTQVGDRVYIDDGTTGIMETVYMKRTRFAYGPAFEVTAYWIVDREDQSGTPLEPREIIPANIVG